MSQRLPPKQPWPMKWIVIAILVCIVPYTWITLRYRKPGPAFEPYHDTKERAQVKRLVDAGFRRVALTVLATNATPAGGPTVSRTGARPSPGGVPQPLRDLLIDQPQLPIAIREVDAPPTASVDATYPIALSYSVAEPDQRIARGFVYVHEYEVVVIPEVDSSGAAGSPAASSTLLQLPTRLFDRGTYTVTLVGQNESRSWQVEAH
jgi:hypothetical protein